MISKVLSLLAASLSYITSIVGCSATPIDDETLKVVYGTPLPETTKQLKVYHLGHSLVGRDMPAMLKQLAGRGHDYRSQLGWGASLESHWEIEVPIKGFKSENSHRYYQDVYIAINSKSYDVFVLTESVEIKAAIKFNDSDKYLAKFAENILRNNPESRLYFYETWHEVTDDNGWVNRLNTDYQKYWLGEILDKAMLINDMKTPIYVIPVGQVMSALFTELESTGGVESLSRPEDIFRRKTDGSLDPIHMNDIGNYLVAIVHYAVLYQRSPVGLPYKLRKAKGSWAIAPSEEAAELMQSITWKVVSSDYRTGLIGF